MTNNSMKGKESELFTFMKEQGYPVFHQSNVFLRDVEYGIRDYHRVTMHKDIGTRESRRMAKELIQDMEQRGLILPLSRGTWILNMPQFLNKPKEEPAPAAAEKAA